MSDIVRIGDRIITRSRALAIGLIDEEGNIRQDAPVNSQAAKFLRRAEADAAWRESQRLDEDVDTTDDGLVRAQPMPKQPLRPQNVDEDGNPITDPEALDEIARKTAEIGGITLSPQPGDLVQGDDDAFIAGEDTDPSTSVEEAWAGAVTGEEKSDG